MCLQKTSGYQLPDSRADYLQPSRASQVKPLLLISRAAGDLHSGRRAATAAR